MMRRGGGGVYKFVRIVVAPYFSFCCFFFFFLFRLLFFCFHCCCFFFILIGMCDVVCVFFVRSSTPPPSTPPSIRADPSCYIGERYTTSSLCVDAKRKLHRLSNVCSVCSYDTFIKERNEGFFCLFPFFHKVNLRRFFGFACNIKHQQPYPSMHTHPRKYIPGKPVRVHLVFMCQTYEYFAL